MELELEAIARERGIRGYYKLRKAELIHALEARRLVEQKSNIFDESIPNNHTLVLQPTSWRPSNIALKIKQNIKNFAEKKCKRNKISLLWVCKKIKDFGEWLLNYIPPKPKVVDILLESFKNKIKKMCSNHHNPNLLWRILRFSIE